MRDQVCGTCPRETERCPIWIDLTTSFSEFLKTMSCTSIHKNGFFSSTRTRRSSMQVSSNVVFPPVSDRDADQGVDPASLKGTNTGFYFGSCFQETNCQLNDPTKCPAKIPALVTRVSRHFQFRGPIVQTDTACGSSFTGLAEAYAAIAHGICDQAVAAGSNTIFRPRVSLQFRDLKMIAKEGKCKCLDQEVRVSFIPRRIQ